MRAFRLLGLVLGWGAVVGCTGGTKSPGSGGTTGATTLVSQLMTETNGATAIQAYKDHQPTALESAELAAYVSFVIEAKQTGALDLGFLASNLASEVQQIALQYPDFFSAGPDGGLIPKPRLVNSPADFSCSNNCQPGAGELSSAFLNALPPNLEAAASAFAGQIGSAAQTLETSGTPVGTAFDQALQNASAATVQNVLTLIDQAFTQSGDLAAAAATLGLSTTETADLNAAVAAILVLGLQSDVVVALQNAEALATQCQAWQLGHCGTSGGSSGTTGTGGTGGSTGVIGSGTNGGRPTGGGPGTTGGGPPGNGVTLLSSQWIEGGGFVNGNPGLPILARNSQGNLLAGWLQDSVSVDGGCANIMYVSLYDSTTQIWSAPALVANGEPEDVVDAGPSCPVNQDSYFALSTYAAALSDNGDALVTWINSPPPPNVAANPTPSVWANHYSASSQSWTGPTEILPPVTEFYATTPSAALNANGDGWVVLVTALPECGTGASKIVGIPYSVSGGFGNAAVINSSLVCPITCNGGGVEFSDPVTLTAEVVALSDGTFVAAWSEADANSCGTSMETYALAGARGTATSWSPPFDEPVYTYSNDYPVLLGLQAGGTSAVAGWIITEDAGGPYPTVPLAITGLKSGDNNWETPQLLELSPQKENIAIAMSSAGTGVVSWPAPPTDAGGFTLNALAAPLDSNLQMGTITNLTAACSLTSGLSNYSVPAGLAAAANSAGGAAVVWPGNSNGQGQAGITYTAGSGWSTCEALPGAIVNVPQVVDIGGGKWGTLDWTGPDFDPGVRDAGLFFQTNLP